MTATIIQTGRPAVVRRRNPSLTIILVLAAIVALLACASLAAGVYTLSIPDLIATLFGQGTGRDNLIVWRIRFPRMALGILAGAALAVSGALFQTLLRNPLASPDIIGVSGGASVAASASILLFGLSGASVSIAAFLGAAIVAAAIYLLAWKDGVSGYRFVLIGVGVAFMTHSALGYLMTRGDVRDVSAALVWMVGGLGGASWEGIVVLAVGLAILLPLLALLVPRLRVLQLGDDVAGGLGVPTEATRLALIAIAVALCALATAFVGPLAFVAFVSAPIARRLLGGGSLAMVVSALVGMVIVLAADFAAQHLLPGGVHVPAGIVTGIIGAPYLLWLLATTNRGGKGA